MPPSTDTATPLELPATLAPSEAPPSPTEPRVANQAALFRWLRARLARNGLRVMMETGRLRFFTMMGTSLFVGLFVLILSWYAFHEMYRFRVPIKGLIVGGLFDLMFFTLGGMLIFSTGIILYASLFTAPEARFLLASPATADQIFASKFQAAVMFSSWAFLILGVPILVSYGLVAGVPWYFYPLLPVTLVGFVLLPGSISALACLLFVRYFPRNRRQVFIVGGIVLGMLLSFWLYRVGTAAKNSLAGRRDEVDTLIAQFAMTQHPLTPSHWMTNAVMAAARDEPLNAIQPVALLWSNGLLAFLIATWAASRLYRTAFDRVAGSGRAKRVYRSNILDTIMEWLVFYLDKPTRILIVKDFRTFRRDPTQWVLLIIFAGLLLLGAMNFRQYYRSNLDTIDRYIVSLVNVAGTSVLQCAGLSRFIFPLISLEGRKFWILGLMPVRREQMLIGKFAFAATGSVIIAEVLILSSDILLGLPPEVLAVHALTGFVVSVGLSGLNVGLGAYMPNFRETDPSKIVVGFGGTVNMVMGLFYLVLIVGLMSAPIYLSVLLKRIHGVPLGGFPPLWAFAGVPIGVILGVLAVYIPLKAGAKALKSTEF